MHMIRSVFRTLTGSLSSGSDDNQSDSSVTSTPAQPQLRSNDNGSGGVGAQQTEGPSLDSRSAQATTAAAGEFSSHSGLSHGVTAMETQTLLTPASNGTPRAGITGQSHTQTTAAAIEQVALEHILARHGTPLPADNWRTLLLDERMLGHMCTNTPVQDCDLLLHMISRQAPLFERPDMIQVSDQILVEALMKDSHLILSALNNVLPEPLIQRLMTRPAFAAIALDTDPSFFVTLSDEQKREAILAPVLRDSSPTVRHSLLRKISEHDLQLALSLAPIEDIIRACPEAVLQLPGAHLDSAVLELAVSLDVDVLPELRRQGLDDPIYEQLCDLALSQSGRALGLIEEDYRTPERVDKAVAHAEGPHIASIPVQYHTCTRLQQALKNMSNARLDFRRQKLSSAFLTHWGLWDTLKQKQDWLQWLPEHERTEALCCEFVAGNPASKGSMHIPEAVQNLHPEWNADADAPDRYAPLVNQEESFFSQPGVPGQSQTHNGTAPWALLLTGAWKNLPLSYREKIWRNGGTEGLADEFKAPPFTIDPKALLDPIQEGHCTRRAAWLPEQVHTKLMFSRHFQLHNARLGAQLRQQLAEDALTLQQAVAHQTLPLWPLAHLAGDGRWQRRGGRTLVRTEQDNGLLHIKLHRQGESLATLVAEKTVQDFARRHQEELGLRSEIPQAGEIWLVPLDELPPAARDCPDALETFEHDGRQCALAFCFTTKDASYDTLAWQPDDQGNLEQARLGLLKAFHDLGIWSSMGALHTSTICLYHQFLDKNARPELLLSAFFRRGATYPGILRLWNTKASQQSDWGLSGLRDLGDLEFYHAIASFLTCPDAHWALPGYGQRASFVNAIAQNIFGGLLHYMRLHRAADPGYHYKDAQAVTALSQFIEQGCDNLLHGLLGKPVSLKELFAATQEGVEEVYPEWLRRTAEEIIYWSAKQQEGGDCFAEHLKQQGRPCADLYPDHPWQDATYGPHYTEADGENLGANNSKMPLFFLMRGLYVLAAGLADRLSGSQQPEPMET